MRDKWKIIGLLTCVLALVINLAVAVPSAHNIVYAASEFAGGTGTPTDPYQITTAAELDAVRNHLDASYLLMNDIDLSDYLSASGAGYNNGNGWVPIDNGSQYDDKYFKGTFDGGGHTISHLSIDTAAAGYNGLFSRSSGTIVNVALSDILMTFSSTPIDPQIYIGALVGYNQGTVRNAVAEGSITVTESQKTYTIGGLLGFSSGMSDNISADVDTTALMNANIATRDTIGGLVGTQSGASISKAYATGSVSGGYGAYVGGLVGYVDTREQEPVAAMSEVYATGDVSGGDSSYIGALVGKFGLATLSHAYAAGAASGGSSASVGGLFGMFFSSGSVTGSYTTQNPLVGMDLGGSVNTTSVQSVSAMQQSSTFLEWDFTNTWGIDEGETIPYLLPIVTAELKSADVGDSLVMQGTVWSGSLEGPFSIDYTIKDEELATVASQSDVTAQGALAGLSWQIDTSSWDEGNYTIEARASESVRNTSVGSIGSFSVDHTAPTIQFGANGNDDYAKTAATTVIVSDSGSGVGALKYVWTQSSEVPDANASWTTFASGDELSMNNVNGEWYLHIEAYDKAGNSTASATSAFLLDIDSPLVTFNPFSESGYLHSISTQVTVSDALSGVDEASLKYVWTNSSSEPSASEEWTAFTSGDTLTKSSPDGEWYLHITSSDQIGNTHFTVSSGFKLNNNPPVISFGTNGSATPQPSVSTTIQVKMIPDMSGVDGSSLKYVWTQSESAPGDEASWSNFHNGDTITLAGEDGDWYLHVRASSNNGNAAEASSQRFVLNTSEIASVFSEGSGTPQDPYRIATAEQLDAVRSLLFASYMLQNDIDLTSYLSEDGDGYNGGAGWEPIGDMDSPFTGEFDGAGHLISHLTMVSSASLNGLFGASAGSIANISLTSVNMQMNGANSVSGSLVGMNSGRIVNAYAEGSLMDRGVDSTDGGLVGGNVGKEAIIENAGADVDLSVGDASGSLTAGFAGGLIGANIQEAFVQYAYSTGDIIGGENIKAGGFAGANYNAKMRDVYASGDVEGGDGSLVGGLTGLNYQALIEQAHASGDVYGDEEAYIGGLVGVNSIGGIQNVYASGDVEGWEDSYAGGLVGGSYGEIAYSYATGTVSGDDAYPGGSIGLNEGTLYKSIALQEPLIADNAEDESVIDSAVVTAAELKEAATYADWENFADVWGIDEGVAAPHLLPAIIKTELGEALVKDTLPVQGSIWSGLEGEPLSVDYAIIDASNETITHAVYNESTAAPIASINRLVALGAIPDGAYTLQVTVAEGAGGSVSSDPLTFTVDQSEPAVSFAVNGGEAYVHSAATTVTVNDDSSGVESDSLQYVWTQQEEAPVAEAAWSDFASGDSLMKEGVSGDWVLHIRAADVVGNKANVSSNRFRLDNMAPTVTLKLQAQDQTILTSGDWTNQNVTASVYSTDDESGVDLVEISLDNGESWQNYSDPLTLTSEGMHSILARATDELGNQSADVEATTGISRSGLSLKVSLSHGDSSPYASGDWTSESVTASVYAHQSTPDVEVTSTNYSLDNGALWHSYSEPLLFNSEGVYSLMVKTEDSAGNVLTSDKSIRIDQSGPTVNLSVNGNASKSASVWTVVTVTDGSGSGVDASSLQYVWTQTADTPTAEASWIELASGDTLSKRGAEGDWYLLIRATDLIGNRTDFVSNVYHVGTSSSGAGSNPLPQIPSTKPPVNDTGELGGYGEATTTVENGETVVTAKVDADKLKSTLDGAEETDETSVVTIPVTGEADRVRLELDANGLQTLQSRRTLLQLATPNGNYSLPSSQINLEGLAAQFDGTTKGVNLTVYVDIAKSDDKLVELAKQTGEKEGFTLVVPPVEFTITVSDGSRTITVDRFSAYVEREIPLPNNVDPSQITTAVVLNPDGTTRTVPTKFISKDGQYYAVINSMTNSAYMLIAHPVNFTDVDAAWAQGPVSDLASRIIINGVDADHFNPNAAITRAEFAAIVVRALGLAEEGEPAAFSDVKPGDWYAGAVTQAKSYGIVHGYADGTFRPNAKVTREEAMAMIANAMKVAGLPEVDAAQDTALSAFTDQQDVSSWAKAAMAAAVQADLVHGNGGKLLPGSNITRAETAVIVQRLLVKAGLI
ncbi:S-layer homology domain-containing protein [Paenibacillus sp. HB172176]|uniref:S-layer homology domain-containing protein n=1 Tax=Paenibacillus sp. HB172176 TaxID=2493690 RepID=UPI00143955D8|nr:S-layer homology domain-containing protein [Paenibacillus sp. HB172176]